MLDRLTLSDKRIDEIIGVPPGGRRAGGPRGRGHRRAAAGRLPAGKGTDADWCHRHDLRVAAERDRGRGSAVPEVGQRGDPPRRAARRWSPARPWWSASAKGWAAPGWTGTRCSTCERTEHEAIDFLVKQTGLIDLVVPRGREALIRRVTENATVPVIKHYKGVCHIYVDETADLAMAADVVTNSKVQRPGHVQRAGEASRGGIRCRAVPARWCGNACRRSSSAGTRRRAPSSPGRSPPPRRSGTRSTSTSSSR